MLNDNPFIESHLASGAQGLHPRALSEPYMILSLLRLPLSSQFQHEAPMCEEFRLRAQQVTNPLPGSTPMSP